MTEILNAFAKAVRMLTIFPLKLNEEGSFDETAFVISVPIVGLIIGLILSLVANGLILFMWPPLLSFILLVSYIVMTRMFHIDGLMDSVEGLLGGAKKEDALKIMKDPHVGAFGVVVLLLYILGFWLLTWRVLDQSSFNALSLGVLLVMPCLARWSVLFIATYSESAQSEGLGKWFIQLQSKKRLGLASLFPIVFLFGVFHWWGLLVLTGVLLISWLIKVWAHQRLEGVNGDILGFGLEVNQLFILFCGCFLL